MLHGAIHCLSDPDVDNTGEIECQYALSDSDISDGYRILRPHSVRYEIFHVDTRARHAHSTAVLLIRGPHTRITCRQIIFVDIHWETSVITEVLWRPTIIVAVTNTDWVVIKNTCSTVWTDLISVRCFNGSRHLLIGIRRRAIESVLRDVIQSIKLEFPSLSTWLR